MTDLTPVATLSPVVQLETNTLALGGTGNPMNFQAQALLNRDAFRAVQIAAAEAETAELGADLASSGDLLKGAAKVGRSTVSVESIFSLLSIAPVETSYYSVASYHQGWAAALSLPIGGGVLYWEPNRPKSEHNGGDIISNTVPWTGALATLPDFLNGVGETLPAGTGCYVRAGGPEVHVASFGAVDRLAGDSTAAAQKALSVASVRAAAATAGQSVTIGDLSIKVSGTLDVDPGVHFSGNGIRSVIELDNTVDIDVVTMTGGGPPSSVRNMFIRRPAGAGVGTKAGLLIGPGDGKFAHQVWASGHLNGFHAKEVGDVIISECLAELNNYNFRLENPARVKMVDCISFFPNVLGCYAFKDNNIWADRRLEIKNFSSVGSGGASRGLRIERVGTFTDEFDDCEVEIFAIDHATGVESVGMKSVKIKANTTSCTTGISLSSSINMKIQHISIDDGTGLTQSSDSTYLNILPGSEYKNPATRAMTLASTVKCAETVFEGAESYPSINSASIGHIFEFGQCILKSPTFTALLAGSNYTVKFNECLQVGTAHSISSTATATRLVLRNNNGDTDGRTILFNNEILSGAVSPASTVTPSYVGQHYRDTVAATTWIAIGLTNTSWVQIQ